MSGSTRDERPTILYFGNDWTAENRTSSHHVARWLAQRYRVIYVESPGLRAPKGTGRDMKKLVSKVALALRGAAPDAGGAVRPDADPDPAAPFRARAAREPLLLLAALRLLMWRAGIAEPISWFVVPHMAPVAGQLGERLSVYYCIDDYAALPDVDAEAIQRDGRRPDARRRTWCSSRRTPCSRASGR